MSKQRLNEQKQEVISNNFLEQDPEGFRPATAPADGDLIITKKMPEYERVEFLNGRDPGEALYFHYASGTHPLKQYTLFHGKEYELPVEIIEHLETRAECQYGHRINAHMGKGL